MIACIEKYFYLVYQPICDSNRNIKKLEVLIRFSSGFPFDPNPQKVIETSEEDKTSIAAIDNLVLSQVVKDITKLLDQGIKPRVSFAINVSPITVATSAQYLDTLNNIPERISRFIEIEILESKTPGYLLKKLEENIVSLSKKGFPISLDDFGVGHACLQKLTLPGVTNLKIDGALTKVHQCQQSAAIVRSVISMAHSFSKTVTAEKIETQEQFDAIKVLGCDFFQGWHLSMPVEYSALEELLV